MHAAKVWVPKGQGQEVRAARADAAVRGKGAGGNASSTASKGYRAMPTSSLSLDEVQHGLSMLLHQFKAKASVKANAAPVPQRKAPQKQAQPGAALLYKLKRGPKPAAVLVVDDVDMIASASEQIYASSSMLHARHYMQQRPEGFEYHGPKWGVELRPNTANRPAQISISLADATLAPTTPLSPLSPPPLMPAVLGAGLRVGAPVFQPSSPAWSADADIDARCGYLGHDNSLAACMQSAAFYQNVAQAQAPTYYGECGMRGMGLLEVPMWPTDPSVHAVLSSWAVPAATSGFGLKAEGMDMEDQESTAASSGQPSPLHTPIMDQGCESQARRQVEYWLSPDNLARDEFLRSQMDAEGYVSLEVLANFPKMMQTGLNAQILAGALVTSTHVEVSWDAPPRARTRRREVARKPSGSSEEQASSTPPVQLVAGGDC